MINGKKKNREHECNEKKRSAAAGCVLPLHSHDTVFVRRIIRLAVVRDPCLHGHEIGHEGRDGALEDGRVASDHELVTHSRLVSLRHHCKPVTPSIRLSLSPSQITAHASRALSARRKGEKDRRKRDDEERRKENAGGSEQVGFPEQRIISAW